MASHNSVCYQSGLLVLLAIITFLVAHQSQTAEAQPQTACSSQLSNLGVCAQFAVPGSHNPLPSVQCCSALRAVDHDCICNALRIAFRLPSLCNIPSPSCDAN